MHQYERLLCLVGSVNGASINQNTNWICKLKPKSILSHFENQDTRLETLKSVWSTLSVISQQGW